MKTYERPVVIATYTAKELKTEAAMVVANSYNGGNNWNGGGWNDGPR